MCFCCCCYLDLRCVELVTRLLDCSFTQSDTDMLFDDFKAMNKSTLVGGCTSIIHALFAFQLSSSLVISLFKSDLLLAVV